MDIICLSETYLDASVPINNNLQIPVYSFVPVDDPSNMKCRWVSIYYKSFLLIKSIDVKYLHESSKCELRIGGKFESFCFF